MPAILILGLLAATAAAETDTLQRSAPWVVDSNENFCRLKAEFGGKKDRLDVRLAWFSPGDTFALTLIGNRARKTAPYTKVDLDFGLGRIETTADTAKIGNQPALLITSTDILPRPDNDEDQPAVTRGQEDAASSLTVSVDGRDPFKLALGPLGEPMSVIRACFATLVKRWNYDPEVVLRLSRRPTPLGSPSRWIDSIDYPDGAIMFRAGGVVRFRLDVDELGKVAGCNILFRTKPDDFADVTCAGMLKRAQFQPALDVNGKPVRSFYIGSVVFRIRR